MVEELDSWRDSQTHCSTSLNLDSIRTLRHTLTTHPRILASSSQEIDSPISIFVGTTGIYLTTYCLTAVTCLESNGTDCEAYLDPRPPALFRLQELKLRLYSIWIQQDGSDLGQTYLAIVSAS